jgi:hypothetical protein
VSRSTHVPLERSETALHGGAPARLARRRAALEEELAVALAVGDRERASELRMLITAMSEGLGV